MTLNRIALLGLLASTVVSASDYDYTDAYSSASQRSEWSSSLQSRSDVTIKALFHPLGHLHAISGSFRLSGNDSASVATFLESIRSPLGILASEKLQYLGAENVQRVSYVGGVLRTTFRTQYRYAVTYQGYSELNRELRAYVDPELKSIRGIFNGHVPALGGYVSGVVISGSAAISAAQNAEGGAIAGATAQLGWYTNDWLVVGKPGKKRLAYFVTGSTSIVGTRDYLIDAANASVLHKSADRVSLVNQVHLGYSENGYPYFDTRNPSAACVTAGGSCTEPALSESLQSRDIFPTLTSAYEVLTGSGATGVSGGWRLPASFASSPRLSPYQNGFSSPQTDVMTIAVASGSFFTSFCPQGSFPCNDYRTYVFGERDTDPSVYSHEYAHGFVRQFKQVVTGAIGPEREVTEGSCDIVGVGFEGEMWAQREPCARNVACSGNRTDFVLDSPLSQQGQPGAHRVMRTIRDCRSPREWMGSAFANATDNLALELVTQTCPPNALCGLPTRPGRFVWEQDAALELELSAFIQVLEQTPAFPRPGDILASVISLDDSPSPGSAFTRMRELLESNTVGVPCP